MTPFMAYGPRRSALHLPNGELLAKRAIPVEQFSQPGHVRKPDCCAWRFQASAEFVETADKKAFPEHVTVPHSSCSDLFTASSIHKAPGFEHPTPVD